MKKILTIICLLFLFASCKNEPTKVENPQKETTVQLQLLAATDTTTYKVVEYDDVVYVIKDNLVIKKVGNDSGAIGSLIIILFVVLIVAIILIKVKD